MQYLIIWTMDHFFCAVALPMWTMWAPASVQNNHMATPVSKPSEPCLRNLHQHAPEPSGTCLRNLHQHAPELCGICRNPPEPSGTLHNLPELASGTYTSTHRNLPELSGTFSTRTPWNSPALCGTLRNPPEPASDSGTSTSTRRNPPQLPEPLSGTCSCDPHRTHRSLSGLKTPLAYAVEEKNIIYIYI